MFIQFKDGFTNLDTTTSSIIKISELIKVGIDNVEWEDVYCKLQKYLNIKYKDKNLLIEQFTPLPVFKNFIKG